MFLWLNMDPCSWIFMDGQLIYLLLSEGSTRCQDFQVCQMESLTSRIEANWHKLAIYSYLFYNDMMNHQERVAVRCLPALFVDVWISSRQANRPAATSPIWSASQTTWRRRLHCKQFKLSTAELLFMTSWLVTGTWNLCVHILGISSSQLTFICFRGVETTKQLQTILKAAMKRGLGIYNCCILMFFFFQMFKVCEFSHVSGDWVGFVGNLQVLYMIWSYMY